ncbi:MAG: DUF4040 domain-containing protein [Chloroflexi bacterium]|nr:DUF4040 domain-containing protein [Chloroflexota bacterium]
MINIVLVLFTLFCAFQAVRSHQLISAALWLAGVSAIVAGLLYRLGAHDVAVIELSVGAGLVTILFVFAISVAGADVKVRQPVVPRLLSIGLLTIVAVLFAWLLFPMAEMGDAQLGVGNSFAITLWEVRGLDVLLQIGLMFGAVMCILGLIGETKAAAPRETAVLTSVDIQPKVANGTVVHQNPIIEKEKSRELELERIGE